MKALPLFLVLGLITQIKPAHSDPKSWIYQRMLKQERAARDRSLPSSNGFVSIVMPNTKVTQGKFDQVIDHFARARVQKKAPTFKQRYFIDSTFAKGKDAPVIYYLCGEGTCEGASDTPIVNQIAKKYKAYRIALEHRYYGESQPFATLESANLKYLSMDQAIEDLAAFQKYVQSTQGLSGKWISVGGSYPGELSAFYRLKHPELVAGALASSAPVLAKADFFEYDRHVARVAGAECLKAIKAAVSDVEAKLKQDDSTAEVKKLFGASDVKNNVDFLYVLADMSAIAIQYGYQTSFCKTITEGLAEGKVTEAYAKAGNDLFSAFGLTAVQDSFQGAESTDPKAYLGWAGMRSWMYQSCTEFGFYQVANSDLSESSRSQQLTLEYHNDVCNRLFGLKTPVNIEKTNKKYYDQLFQAGVKNIYFTNGSNDPWSNLSITSESQIAMNPGLKLFVINGSAHCDDLGSRVSTALTQARNEFDALVQTWLSE